MMSSEHDRTLKTHLPLRYWKKQLDAQPTVRCIQIVRNPKDVLLSYYKYYCINTHFGPYQGSWTQFFELVKNKQLIGGDYFDHQIDWYCYNRSRENSLIIFYEQMKSSPEHHIKVLAEFLNVNLSEKALNMIAERTQFAKMSTDPKLMVRGPFIKGNFMRNGGVGGWKSCYTRDQSDFIDVKCSDALQRAGLKFDFE